VLGTSGDSRAEVTGHLPRTYGAISHACISAEGSESTVGEQNYNHVLTAQDGCDIRLAARYAAVSFADPAVAVVADGSPDGAARFKYLLKPARFGSPKAQGPHFYVCSPPGRLDAVFDHPEKFVSANQKNRPPGEGFGGETNPPGKISSQFEASLSARVSGVNRTRPPSLLGSTRKSLVVLRSRKGRDFATPVWMGRSRVDQHPSDLSAEFFVTLRATGASEQVNRRVDHAGQCDRREALFSFDLRDEP